MTKTVLGDEKKELLQLNPVLGAGFAASILVRFRVESCDFFFVFFSFCCCYYCCCGCGRRRYSPC